MFTSDWFSPTFRYMLGLCVGGNSMIISSVCWLSFVLGFFAAPVLGIIGYAALLVYMGMG